MNKLFLLKVICLFILAACVSGCKKDMEADKSPHGSDTTGPKTTYGKAVKSAKDLKDLGAKRSGEMQKQADSMAGEN